MLNYSLGTDTSEYGRDVGDGADLRFLVAVLAWDYGFLVRKFFREYYLKTFSDAHMAQSLADYIGQRAVE